LRQDFTDQLAIRTRFYDDYLLDSVAVDMAETMGGLGRYERRYQWFSQHRRQFADALE
jgi:hypothetical protein